MNPETLNQNFNSSTSMDDQHQDQDQDQDQDQGQDQDHHINNKSNDQNVKKIEPSDLDLDLDQCDNDVLDQDTVDINGEPNEPDSFCCMNNDPPGSYAVCRNKVSDWLDQNTFIERNPSVKFACSRNQDSCQMPSARRSVSINQRPKLSIIGFRKKPVQKTDAKSKHNDRVENIRLFRNRSEPGKDYCLLITEPVSPKVSCVGRVGSVRVVQKRKAGVWKSFKSAFLNMVQTNRVTKIAA